MNPIRRWRLKNQLRVAARLNATGQLTDVYYGAVATHIVFELGGHVLRDDDATNPVDLELTAHRAFGKGVGFALDPALEREFGPYGSASTFLKAVTGSYVWGEYARGVYAAALPLVQPLPRFEAYVADVRKRYPALTGLGAWLGSLIVAGVLGAWIARLFTCP
jgi:hypothetical protein